MNIPEKNQDLLKSLGTGNLYIKFFDVDWDEYSGQPMPHASVIPESALDSTIEIVPTVFITNRTFEKLESYQLYTFKENVYNKVTQLIQCFPYHVTVKEVQIDCDWSEGTKDKYFEFMKAMNERFDVDTIALSATIRLHQVKYAEKTGVPPVDKGILMFYNMGDVTDAKSENSIFDEKTAGKYLKNFDEYPLKLDVALPIFSWAAIYREDKLIQLVTNFENSLQENKNLKKVEENLYQATAAFEVNNILVKEGDQVKFELVSPELTKKAAEMIKPHLKNDSLHVVLFDFNENNLKRFNEDDIEDIYNTFN